MKLGDFFAAAPYARPVNPRTVTITAITTGRFLPDGSANNPGRTVAAQVTGALVFLTGEEYLKARQDAHRAIAAMRVAKADAPPSEPTPFDDLAFDLELAYQILWRSFRDWDEATKTTGEPLFPSADALRKMVVPSEAGRAITLYNDYVKDEHPEAVDPKTFRGTENRS